MLRNLGKETHILWGAVSEAMQVTYPSKQFAAQMIMAGINLGLTERKIRQTINLNERRKLTHEFDRTKRAIERGTTLLNKGPQRETIPPQRKAVCVS